MVLPDKMPRRRAGVSPDSSAVVADARAFALKKNSGKNVHVKRSLITGD